MVGVSVQAVWKWVGQYNGQGLLGLQGRGRGGRRWSYLTEEQELHLLNSLEEKAEKGDVLTARQVLPLACNAAGRKVSLAYVYGLLHRHQWRKLGPGPRHVKSDADARETFKKLPGLIEEKAREAPAGAAIRVLFEDEWRFGRISDRRRCRAPLPIRPQAGSQIVRQYVYAFIAPCPFDGRIASLILPWSDTTAMTVFLKHTARQFAGDFCILILDGAGWHHADELDVPENIRLLFLPPYSPELNPVEHVWEHLRETQFRNDALPDLDAVEDRLMDGIRDLTVKPDLVTSMALFSWIKLYV